MADLAFHHGSRVFDSAGSWIDVELANSAVVKLYGTAPDADASVFPLNRTVLIKGSADYSKVAKLGRRGSLRGSLDAIYDQGGASKLGAYVYVTRIAAGQTHAETMSNLVGDRADMTGVYAALRIPSIAGYGREMFKPRIFVAPGYTGPLAQDGVRAVGMDNQGGGYSTKTFMTVTGGGGRGTVLVPQIVDGAIVGAIVQKPGWGYTGTPTITITDPDTANNRQPGSGAQAQAMLGTVGNPVAHAMEGLAAQFRAVAFIDGAGTTPEDAVLARETYGSDRLYMIDAPLHYRYPVSDFDRGAIPFDAQPIYDGEFAYVPGPASPAFVGVQCRSDRDNGVVRSVSNQYIYGVDGPVRTDHYPMGTNYLNQNRVATVHNYGQGCHTWGNRTTSGMFLPVRRTRDLVNEALEMAYLRAVDRPMLDLQIRILEEVGRDFLTTLERRNYIMGGSSEFRVSRTKNLPGPMRQGRIIFDLKYETPPPMEDVVIEADDNIQAYELLLDRLAGAYGSGTGTLIERPYAN
jgi:phage tail sheath protein FI